MNTMKLSLSTLVIFIVLKVIECFPLETSNERRERQLSYFDILPSKLDYNNLELTNGNYMPLTIEDNPLSRAVPSRKQNYDSPVYYIRMPPQPYVFVSGIGYVSPPVSHPMSQLLNIPVPFVSNGKPNSIYQWSGGFQNFPTEVAPTYPSYTQVKPKPQESTKKPLADSTIHRLPGNFAFNGKPEDIYVLRDSYNSLLSDVLQNVYP
ncbi:uncharacterized protein LOC130893052 [Diorhabda carinulata]|uniref:uncharacterized protein LOC130893052 n=1 Tax=Diorhabda carinulata TaxID=1163345 RepID=UPI0025A2D285|nr:uncharacterized protein LOC130893052 [Diorhabda carinulata]